MGTHEQLNYLKHGLFNEHGELVIATESATKAFEIAKTYKLKISEIK